MGIKGESVQVTPRRSDAYQATRLLGRRARLTLFHKREEVENMNDFLTLERRGRRGGKKRGKRM